MNRNFLGADQFIDQNGRFLHIKHKRVGLIGHKMIARRGMDIYYDNYQVGKITSGTLSPSLNKPIAMGYVPQNLAKIGTVLKVKKGDQYIPFEITKMPFLLR